MSIERRPSWLERKLLLSPIKAYLKHKYQIELERNDTAKLKPPYIILANHTNKWDPLFINCFVEDPICFVADAPLFRNPLLKRVLDYTGAIPKATAKNETGTIRNMLTAKKHNRVIGIFPEGNCCWDGTTKDIAYATAKLVKLLNIPVVIGHVKGGYLSHPRWADHDRKGKITVSLEKKWDEGELQAMSVEAVHQGITAALAYNEIAWQAEQRVAFQGQGLANYLERALFVCPSCKTVGKLHSEGRQFSCTACGYSVIYNELGYFEPKHKPMHFQFVHQWNAWQLQYTKTNLHEQQLYKAWRQALADEVKLYVSSSEESPFMQLSTGKLTWHRSYLLYKPHHDAEPLKLPIERLEGINVHLNSKLDFYMDNNMLRFDFFHPRSSAYMWYQVIRHSNLQQEAKLQ
ncbi:hypothetical protein J40TS1_21660 [Paenibacillus montaniterrae]|uniref:Phospholipid/glycerol acyltransferase domain-containing protein n=1 Tax=Paenibacillus montaniterrae TaxID=429341 RepID=A0A920CZ03_9BACL|nr:lysophospholipid acyltransferase family protein [Paenibacillus montaniterrae]GIP16524.1 hypothetical protein J40TS1_21660 [Paenibacillus montaniterrae]